MRYASTATKNGRETAVVVLPLWEVPGFDPDRPHPQTYAAPDEVEVGWVRDADAPGGWAPPPPPTFGETWAAYKSAVEARLDAFAQERDYRDMAAACSYVSSAVPAWAAEGAHCVALRDATWTAFYAAMDARPAITLADLLGTLPPLEWPATGS